MQLLPINCSTPLTCFQNYILYLIFFKNTVGGSTIGRQIYTETFGEWTMNYHGGRQNFLPSQRRTANILCRAFLIIILI